MTEGWKLTEKIILEMKRACDSIGTRFAAFEVVGGAEGISPSQELKEFTHKVGFPLIESNHAFDQKALSSTQLRFKDQIHWTAGGHEVGAELIYEFLAQSGWIEK